MRKETLAYNIRSIELSLQTESISDVSADDNPLFIRAVNWMLDSGLRGDMIRHIIIMARGKQRRFFNPKKQIEQYQRNIR